MNWISIEAFGLLKMCICGALGAAIAALTFRVLRHRTAGTNGRYNAPLEWMGFGVGCIVWLFSTSVWALTAVDTSVLVKPSLTDAVLVFLFFHPYWSTIMASGFTTALVLLLGTRLNTRNAADTGPVDER